MPRQRFPIRVLLVIAILELGLLVYSQMVAYWGDESLHLVAAELINAGQRPYLDFFYHHTPLLAYLLALLIRVFGESWRVAHVLSALMTGGCVFLTAVYVFTRMRVESLQSQSAVLAALLMGLNCYIISFGTVALPYGFCLFFMVAGFFLVVESVDRPGSMWAFAGGACAAAAPAAYLLTAPLVPLLFVWMIGNNRQGSLLRKSGWYALGAALPFIPLLWLAAHSPHQVWADLILYHLFHRAGRDLNLWFNLREIAGWFISIQGVILITLAIAGLTSMKSREKLDERLRSESLLIMAIILGFCFVVSIARPTSSFYFVLITPFVVMPAAFGLCVIHLRFQGRVRYLVILVLLLLYVTGLSAERYIWRTQTSYIDHREVAKIARTVDEITPATGMIYAFEAVYFEAHRLPPPGLENRFNPASLADEWLRDGRFDTVCIGSTNPKVVAFGLLDRYFKQQTVTVNGYQFLILWERTGPQSPSGGPMK